ncbi:hypothetical protein A2U01_0027473, partial [Trifolium medium]|nr:hypothetical protein [Trifolium medium]
MQSRGAPNLWHFNFIKQSSTTPNHLSHSPLYLPSQTSPSTNPIPFTPNLWHFIKHSRATPNLWHLIKHSSTSPNHLSHCPLYLPSQTSPPTQ